MYPARVALRIGVNVLKTISKIPRNAAYVAVNDIARFQNNYLSTSAKLNAGASMDAALRDFLREEIEAEKEVAKKQLGEQNVLKISGFEVKTDEAEVTLTRLFNNEKITVSFNVNECVRPQDDLETGTMDKLQEEQQTDDTNLSILAEPSFRVQIEKK